MSRAARLVGMACAIWPLYASKQIRLSDTTDDCTTCVVYRQEGDTLITHTLFTCQIEGAKPSTGLWSLSWFMWGAAWACVLSSTMTSGPLSVADSTVASHSSECWNFPHLVVLAAARTDDKAGRFSDNTNPPAARWDGRH